MPPSWNAFVTAYRATYKCSFKDALKEASPLYRDASEPAKGIVLDKREENSYLACEEKHAKNVQKNGPKKYAAYEEAVQIIRHNKRTAMSATGPKVKGLKNYTKQHEKAFEEVNKKLMQSGCR
jgi:4-diphosphocytidyl-2C-methyl-D-erythritol kinase